MKGIKNENDGKKSLHSIRRNGIRQNGIRRNGIRRNGKTPIVNIVLSLVSVKLLQSVKILNRNS